MASYSLTGILAVHDKTLVANTADSVTLSGVTPGEAVSVEVLIDGTADTYVRTDGGTATVSGPFSVKLPGSGAPNAVNVFAIADNTKTATVSIISAGTPKYSVTRN